MSRRYVVRLDNRAVLDASTGTLDGELARRTIQGSLNADRVQPGKNAEILVKVGTEYPRLDVVGYLAEALAPLGFMANRARVLAHVAFQGDHSAVWEAALADCTPGQPS